MKRYTRAPNCPASIFFPEIQRKSVNTLGGFSDTLARVIFLGGLALVGDDMLDRFVFYFYDLTVRP